MGEARGESRRAAVIGCGALGALTAEGIAKDLAASWRLSGVLANTREHAEKLAGRLGCRALASLDELLEDRPDMVVEAAGVGAARAHAERVLRAGSSLVLLSAGCLADTEFAARLARAAEEGGSVLHVPSGAVGGFDLLRTLSFRDRQLARLGRADGDRLAVRVDNVKPPQGLAGAPWLEHRPLSPVTRETVFIGTAKEAIAAFPKNVNVAVAAAAASAGMDETTVTMTSDPDLAENVHRIEARGHGVRAVMEFASSPDPENPRSSSLAAWSVLALLEQLASPVRFF